MFDKPIGAAGGGVVLGTAELSQLLDQLLASDGTGCTQQDRIDQIAAMERLKGALAAAQARVTAGFDRAHRAQEAHEDVRASRRGRGVASQIALARRDAPARGGRHLGLAHALVEEMPHTHAALARGDISEWRATLMVRETATLSAEDRNRVDAELADELPGLGDAQTAARARSCAYRIDPTCILRRRRGAVADRRVTIRPAPDAMAYVTAHLPVAEGVAVHKALAEAAAQAIARGDPRTRGQLRADTLVERVTGQSRAEDVSVEVELIMTDSALFGGDSTPAQLPGHGPIPAELARRLVRGSAGDVWLRRLFTSVDRKRLIAAESRRRTFPRSLRQLVIWRDQTCRTPWCDAPIRHADHIRPAAAGGQTSLDNGQGLCEACNYAKQAPGWRSERGAGPGDPITVTTPTGHRYSSHAPPPPGADPPTRRRPVVLLDYQNFTSPAA